MPRLSRLALIGRSPPSSRDGRAPPTCRQFPPYPRPSPVRRNSAAGICAATSGAASIRPLRSSRSRPIRSRPACGRVLSGAATETFNNTTLSPSGMIDVGARLSSSTAGFAPTRRSNIAAARVSVAPRSDRPILGWRPRNTRTPCTRDVSSFVGLVNGYVEPGDLVRDFALPRRRRRLRRQQDVRLQRPGIPTGAPSAIANGSRIELRLGADGRRRFRSQRRTSSSSSATAISTMARSRPAARTAAGAGFSAPIAAASSPTRSHRATRLASNDFSIRPHLDDRRAAAAAVVPVVKTHVTIRSPTSRLGADFARLPSAAARPMSSCASRPEASRSASAERGRIAERVRGRRTLS